MRQSLTVLFLCAASLTFGALDTNQDVPPGLAPAGSGTEAAGTWTLEGAGADIWGNSDEFHFVYDSSIVSGDFAVKCHVTSLSGGDVDWAKAGIMARVPTNPSDPRFTGPETYAFCCTTNNQGTCLQFRDGNAAGAIAVTRLGAQTSLPGKEETEKFLAEHR